jgi:hypothetical protein
VDVCLIVYWVATAMHLIPPESAFKDYGNEVVQAWNWSFFPLDLLAVAAGCWGVYLTGKGRRLGEAVLMVGLTLTFCAGFMAISFWAYYGDFTLGWWVPNIVLMLVPCYLCKRLVCGEAHEQ